jgi:hypothetical protein
VEDIQKVFGISWIVIVTMLVLVAVRMPTVFLLLFMLVDVSLVLNLPGIIQSSANMSKAAGWALLPRLLLRRLPRPLPRRPPRPRPTLGSP